VDSLRQLWGDIDEEDIRAAGRANSRAHLEQAEEAPTLRDRCVRSLVEAEVALQRGRLWFMVDHLAVARDSVMELFAAARGAPRALHCFQAEADHALQARLAATLPTGTLASAQQALVRFLDLLEHDLDTLSGGRVWLTDVQRGVLRQLRTRQVSAEVECSASGGDGLPLSRPG
jgi:hypothetical protein